MQIFTYEPSNDLLKKHIKAFYIIEQNENNNKDFLLFPSIYPNLSFSKFTTTEIDTNHIITKSAKNPNFECFLIANPTQPIHNKYIGRVFEISISFKPLGINYFLKQPLSFYLQPNQDFTTLSSEFETALSLILNIKEHNIVLDTLEKYLVSIYQSKDIFFIEKIIEDIIESKGAIEVNEITQKYAISRQTLNTYFHKYLCRSAVETKRIVRFRNASEYFLQKTLTELTYDKNYFDQSHLIKDFKAFTGLTPKRFFARLHTLEGTHLIWE